MNKILGLQSESKLTLQWIKIINKMKLLNSLYAFFLGARSHYLDECRSEFYPQAFDGYLLNNYSGTKFGWKGFTDPTDEDILYFCGGLHNAPFVGKYDASNLKFDWLHLQTANVGNVNSLALTEENNLLAAFCIINGWAVTANLYILHKNSGAPALQAF